MAPFCKAGKISLPQLLSPCEFSQQGEQLKCLKLYKVLILCPLIKNGWECRTWIPSASCLWYRFLWKQGLKPESNALLVFHCFDRKGWSQYFPQEGLGGAGQDLFAYSLCAAGTAFTCYKVFGFKLSYRKFSSSASTHCAGMDKLTANIGRDILSTSTALYFLSLITWYFPWCCLLYSLLLGKFLFKIKADASLTGEEPNEFIKSQASCWTDSRAIQLLQSVALPTRFKDQQVTSHHFWQALVLEKSWLLVD